MYDKIVKSLLINTIFLILVPIGIYYGQNSKFMYWVLGFYMMTEVIKDFIHSVTNKLIVYLEKEKSNEKETSN